jgi:carbon starvation protein CstA
MIAQIVFLLCALTSGSCAVLLLRAYRLTRARLLFWSGTSFVLFAITNALLLVDFILGPEQNLSLYRAIVTLVALALLISGLIFDS